MNKSSGPPLTYRDAGVDIAAGDALVDAIKPIARRTKRAGAIGEIGGFGGLFELPMHRYREPVLVSSTDGVGTKLKLAFELDIHDTIGIDLVAMCVNDVIAQGAEPLFFLDYLATGRLQSRTAVAVIEGIGRGCEIAQTSLIGGETAEMPGMYAEGEYDLAGFCVGIVEKSAVIDGRAAGSGDVVIGLTSSGPHANGYSLIRRILKDKRVDLGQSMGGVPLGEVLLSPTRIYVRAVRQACEIAAVHAIAHITGGGLPGNLVRVLPTGTRAVIDSSSWSRPPVFDWLQEQGGIESDEMYRTFNCGIGMVLVVPVEHADRIVGALGGTDGEARVIGHVEAHEGPARVQVS